MNGQTLSAAPGRTRLPIFDQWRIRWPLGKNQATRRRRRTLARWLVCILLGLAGGWVTGSTLFAQDEQPAGATPTAPGQEGNPAATTRRELVEPAERVQVRRVKVNFFINTLHTIDDETGSYVVDFWLDLYWRDPAVAGTTVDDVDPALLWNPQIKALNASELTVLYQAHLDSFEPDTNVHLSQRLVGVFRNRFDLQRFPFDRQWLVITLESSDFDSNRLLFDFMGADQPILYAEKPFTFPLPLGKYISTELALPEWMPTAANVIQQIHVLPYDKSSWAQLRIEIQLARQAWPYVLKIMLVFVLLMLLGATVFALPLTELRYRLPAFLLLLLATITFDFTRLQSSPQLAYLTLLDQQALLCYLLLGLTMSAVVMISALHNRGLSVQAERLNRWAIMGYSLLVILVNLGLGWYGWGG